MGMFCFQCSETAMGKGCTMKGVCGKDSDVANLQDLFVWLLKGLSYIALKTRENGSEDSEVNLFIAEGLFSTVTNVNFDTARLMELIQKTYSLREKLINSAKCTNCEGKKNLPEACTWKGENDLNQLLSKAVEVGVMSTQNEDIRSLRELLVYGLKGIAAYTDHAYILKHNNDQILYFLQEALAATLDDTLQAEDLVGLVLKAGEMAVGAMALLDKANTSSYGNQELTHVYTGTVKGPGILVSGHDLLDLEQLLIQTQGTGVNVYTHGEMLPANAYPKFKEYKNLIGNFGTSWYNQQKEFEEFNGAILMTTNCIQKPKDSYFDKIFTTGLVAWPGVKHIPNAENGKKKDFSALIKKAMDCGDVVQKDGKKIPIGLAHDQLSKVADKIIEAVKSGAIKRFVVMAGCDGHSNEREYYTSVAKELPKDTVILTAGCAKYRYNMLDLGDIGGIPRVVDAGQCNDSYSLALTALKLKEAFGLDDINKLPISYDIAWYEQKAVAVLLALLFLGVKRIRLGPVLPAFVSPNVLKVLVEKFDIKPISSIENDIELIMQGK